MLNVKKGHRADKFGNHCTDVNEPRPQIPMFVTLLHQPIKQLDSGLLGVALNVRFDHHFLGVGVISSSASNHPELI